MSRTFSWVKSKERFLGKMCPEPFSGCWLWMATVNNLGYGEFWLKDGNHYAHRMSWMMFMGEIPNGLWVLHHCDTPCCVNPNHLFLGTHQDNRDDCKKKGRTVRGEKNHFAKLDESIVSEIRSLYAGGNISHRELGKRFNVTHTTIGYIVRRKTWGYLV